MSEIIEVIKTDGTSVIVTVAEAQVMRDAGELAPPVDDGKALTLEGFWGADYADR